MADPTRTERQLLDSIRKAKAAPDLGGASQAANSPDPHRAPDARARSRPAASRTRTREKEVELALPVGETDAYQAGRRVWPD